jgi:ppGpp synthetase/RelA/SpoT-type nucleotidyltranferase
MKLFTKDIDKKLFAQYQKGADLENQMVVAKIFNPYGRGNWYLLNSDPEDPDYIWAIVDLFEVEMGSVSRSELEAIKVPPFNLGLERDLYFEPKSAKEVYQDLVEGKKYSHGGYMEGGGETSNEFDNKTMLANLIKTMKHHIEELEEAVNKKDNIEAWVLAKAERAVTDLQDITHYVDSKNQINGGENKMAKGGKLTPNLENVFSGDDSEYGTFELYKNGGEVEVKIINRDEQYNKDRYAWLLSDYDGDNVSNIDDKKPYDSSNDEKIDNPSLSKSMNYILSLKNSMDDNMYSFVADLKEIAPNKSKIYARTKTPYSIIDKLIKKRLLNPKTGLTDLIGTTIVTSNKKELDEVKKEVEGGKLGRVIEVEDMYAKPKDGYRAYHFLIEKNGMPVELQLKTKRQKALNELSHEPYKLGQLDSKKLISMTEVANRADNGDKEAIKEYDKFISQPNIEKVFYAERGGYMANGGEATNSLVIIKKLLSDRDKLESRLFDAKVKENERWNRLGWGSGMRLSKINVSYKRTDAIKEKMQDIDKKLKLMGYDKFPVGRYEKGGETGVSKHRVYFSTFSEVMDAIHDIAADNGYKVVEIFPDLSYGGVSYGQTKRAKAELEWDGNTKKGKSKKREKNTLNIQIYRMDSGNYELNTYFSYAEGGYMERGGYVAVSEKDGYWIIISKPTTKEKAEEVIKMGGLPRGEVGKVVTIAQAKSHNKLIGEEYLANGGKVGFSNKVNSIKKSLLRRKKVSPSVQSDYGKIYSPQEALQSAKRIVGAMTANDKLKKIIKTKTK